MKKVLISLFAGLTVAVPAVQAGTIGFEDLAPPGCCLSIPANYQGFQWLGGAGSFSWVIANEARNVFDGIEAHSGVNYAWSAGGTNLTLAGAPFELESLWIRTNYMTSPVTFQGFTNGVQTFSSSFNVGPQYQQLNLHFTGIDFLTIDSRGQNVLIDDIVVNTQAVPEPATGATILLGLGMVGFMRRKAKTK